jgi:hypothetical protein
MQIFEALALVFAGPPLRRDVVFEDAGARYRRDEPITLRFGGPHNG